LLKAIKIRKMKKIIFASCIIMAICSSCSNKSVEFPNYKYTTVYFAYQSPVRTLVLGDYNFDNTLDNEHKCEIMATMGGVYTNTKLISINVSVDSSLCNNLGFDNGNKVLMMPSNYYSLPKDMAIDIPSGSLEGGLEVQLTDAFFADPRSITNTFVIPLRMNTVNGADSILSGKSTLDAPDPRLVTDWTIPPKNYILYAIKYINPWHGNYLRRGVEKLQDNSGSDTVINYHTPFVETDQLCSIGTLSLNNDSLMLNGTSRGGANIPFQLLLAFDSNGKCSIFGPSSALYSIIGSGVFIKNGDSWGDQPRDVLHLNYTVDFGTSTHTFTDTLVARDRGIKFETFNPIVH